MTCYIKTSNLKSLATYEYSEVIRKKLEELIENGACRFISGAENAADIEIVCIIIELIKKYTNIRKIAVELFLPLGKKDFGIADKYTFARENADSYSIGQESFFKGSLMKRNFHLLERSEFLLVVQGDESETNKKLVDYAIRNGKRAERLILAEKRINN